MPRKRWASPSNQRSWHSSESQAKSPVSLNSETCAKLIPKTFLTYLCSITDAKGRSQHLLKATAKRRRTIAQLEEARREREADEQLLAEAKARRAQPAIEGGSQ